MKKFKLFFIVISVSLQLSAFAQIQVDHSIQLTGSGANARITGIDSVSGSEDAVSVKTLQNGGLIYATATGSNNSFNISISPPISAYQKGMVFNFISNQNVSGAATLNVNNLGAVPITKYINQALTGCEIQNNQFVTVAYDGTNFQIISVFTSTPATPGAISGTDSVCSNAKGLVYSISPVPNAAGYNWTVPAGDTITANTGTSITVNFGANPAGNITVAATNACPTSAPGTLTVASAFCITDSNATVTYIGDSTIYTFTSNGTLTVSGNGNVHVLVVGGGGGGGEDYGGGGGAGGFIYDSSYAVSAGVYSVTVGAGGAEATISEAGGYTGGNSVFGTLTAIGGGGGSCGNCSNNASTGGSGGGGGWNGSGAAGTPGQGNAGGSGTAAGNAQTAGGGGGAGAQGANGVSGSTSGNGGNGLPCSISGATVVYAGGGGGGGTYVPGTGYYVLAGAGGAGGGGAGTAANSNATGTTGIAGTANTGGGGGGGSGYHGSGAAGGSGIVIVRYP